MLDRIPDRRTLFWLLQGAGWGAFGLSMFVSRLTLYPAWYLAVNKGILTVLGLLGSLVLWRIYRRVWSRSPSPGRVILISVVSSYAVTLPWTASVNLIMEALEDGWRGEPFGLNSWFTLVDGGLYLTFVMLAWSLLYFGIKYYQDLQAERERTLEAQALAHKAQLRTLRYQLNPHFLFNTLNAISTLVVEERTGEAGRMIARLSDFLRLTLDGTDDQEVPLAEELEFARRYLDIEQIRFGDRLRVQIDVDPDALSARVPSLILQPLIENAIHYAVSPRETGGTIELTARRVGDRLHLRLRDDGPGLSGDAADRSRWGVGLTNTRARLHALYGDDHRLDFQRTDGGGLTVIIEHPADFGMGMLDWGLDAGTNVSQDDPAVPPETPHPHDQRTHPSDT